MEWAAYLQNAKNVQTLLTKVKKCDKIISRNIQKAALQPVYHIQTAAVVIHIFGGERGNIFMKKERRTLNAFTLVEVIVVMVILAILAALLIPSLTGYIDKANEQSAIVEARSVLTAAQTMTSEHYGTTKADRAKLADWLNESLADKEVQEKILVLADLGTATTTNGTTTYDVGDNTVNSFTVSGGTITGFVFSDGAYEVTYDKSAADPFTVVAE